MNAWTLAKQIAIARAAGREVAIHMPEVGYWVTKEDRIKEGVDGALYWEHNSRTFLIPAELCWLEFIDDGMPR